MDKDIVDLIKYMLESQAKQLDAIRAELSDIKERLITLEENKEMRSSISAFFMRVFFSWQFWAFLFALYLSVDFDHLRRLLIQYLGQS